MAGDWIKMRSDLHSHPKIVRMASATKTDRHRIVGGLHAVWCLFDIHSVDGKLDGYTLETLDDMVGFPGIAEAMRLVGWIEVEGESLVMRDFDTHNGQSAKRRANDAERKRSVRNLSADEADEKRTREEKRREEQKQDPPASRVPTADAGSKTPRASKRCPESFTPGEEMQQWARAEAPRADFGRELAKFRDHTFKTARSDWPAAFRNWLRTASDDAAKRPQSLMAEKQNEMAKWFKGTSLDSSTQQDYIDAAPLSIR